MVSRYEQVASIVSALYRCIHKIERTEMKKYGLKGPHAYCLIAMGRHPDGITMTELSRICDKDKAAISRAIAELEKAGMVCRVSKPAQRYRVPIFLTEKGKDAVSAVNRVAAIAVEKAGEGMTDEWRQVFYPCLDLISANLQKLCLNGLDGEEFE